MGENFGRVDMKCRSTYVREIVRNDMILIRPYVSSPNLIMPKLNKILQSREIVFVGNIARQF